MSTHTAIEQVEHVPAHARAEVATWRQRLLAVLGPLVSLAGVGWAIVQPYRVTVLHPHGQGFWWLVVEPPLLVVLAGALFHFFVARTLIRDLTAD
jgi:hypothetical protein